MVTTFENSGRQKNFALAKNNFAENTKKFAIAENNFALARKNFVYQVRRKKVVKNLFKG